MADCIRPSFRWLWDRRGNFLDFLRAFNKETKVGLHKYAPTLTNNSPVQFFIKLTSSFLQASPYLDAVNVAALGVGFAPGIAPLVVSMVVPAAVKHAKAAQTDKQ